MCILNGPLPFFVVSTRFGVPSKKHWFVSSNNFETANGVEALIDFAARRLVKIRSEIKFSDIKS